MEPTLSHGASVLACRLAYLLTTPRKGHIVIINHPENGRKVVKRISDIVDNMIFVTGDNPLESSDSRKFGWVKRSDIIAKVFYVL
jgi:nickel-type superoxide dismutase maturation protease